MRLSETRSSEAQIVAGATVLDLRDTLAARWFGRRQTGTPKIRPTTESTDPLRGISTGTVLSTLTQRVKDMDGIEMAFVSLTLTRLDAREVIPPPFQDHCTSIVARIRDRRTTERGKVFPVKRAL